MKEVDLSGTVEGDGEPCIRSAEPKTGRHVRARLVIEDTAERSHSALELRGMLKGTWGSPEAVERYLRNKRDSWER